MRINNTMAKNLFQLHGSNRHTQLTGYKSDIFNLCQFKRYVLCYFSNINQEPTLNKEKLGQVLGPTRGGVKKMVQWILNNNGNIVPRRSPIPI